MEVLNGGTGRGEREKKSEGGLVGSAVRFCCADTVLSVRSAFVFIAWRLEGAGFL
jgi:hypothetical protein